jgi:hypothetical protein
VFGRRHVKSRQDLVRAEFGESAEHFRQAAAHAAGGLGATVGPHLGSAKSTAKDKTASARGFVKPAAGRVTNTASRGWDSTIAVFAPLTEAAKQGSKRGTKLREQEMNQKSAKNKGGNQTSWMAFASTKEAESSGHAGLYVLLATGAAVGAAGALAARRRTRTKWAEYEPSSLHSDASSFAEAGATSKSLTEKSPTEKSATDKSGVPGAVAKYATWTKEHAKSTAGTLRHKIHDATAEHDDIDGSVTDKVDKAAAKTGEKVNEGASHLADKADARYNASTPTGGSTTNTPGSANRTGDRIDDEVDDLIRSSKNGRM